MTENILLDNDALDPTHHPATANSHKVLKDSLTPTELFCRKIATWTGAPLALMAAIVFQLLWIGVGVLTGFDPYPFVFLLTCSNVIQLILIFVIAVAQRQTSMHDEIRAESDHHTISRLLYHHEAQELILVRLAAKLGVSTSDLTATIDSLATDDNNI